MGRRREEMPVEVREGRSRKKAGGQTAKTEDSSSQRQKGQVQLLLQLFPLSSTPTERSES